MMRIHDIEHNGIISFNEFKTIFRDADEQKLNTVEAQKLITNIYSEAIVDPGNHNKFQSNVRIESDGNNQVNQIASISPRVAQTNTSDQ